MKGERKADNWKERKRRRERRRGRESTVGRMIRKRNTSGDIESFHNEQLICQCFR